MQRQAYALLLLTTLLWGGNSVAGKLAVGHVSPMLLNLLRWSLALAVLLPFAWPRVREDWSALRPHAARLLVLGALGFTVFNVALYGALLFTSAVNVSIEQAGIPMLVFALNFLLFRTAVTAAQVLGFVVSIAGILVVASHGELARLLALDLNVGDLMMIGAIVGYAVYTVALRFRPAVHWQSLMAAMCVGAVASAVPFALGEWWAGALRLPDAQGWGVVLYTALLPSIVSQVFYIRAVALIGANRASLFINLVPIFGTVLSLLILREAFHLYHGVAMALALGGIWLAETSGRRTAASG